MSDLFDDEGSNQLSEDDFKLVSIDRVRKKRVSVKLIDAEGDEVPLRDTVKQLMEYIHDKMNESVATETNKVANQIAPLITQALVAGLPEVLGAQQARVLMSLESLRYPVIAMMLLSFSLMKFVQSKNLKIVTMEEDLTDEEIERSAKLSQLGNLTTTAALLGLKPKDVLKELISRGELTIDEIVEMSNGKIKASDLQTDELTDPLTNEDKSDDDDSEEEN